MASSTHFPPGAGVIFDMDGLMLDTERIAKLAWQQAARDAGYEMSDALFTSLIGRRERDSRALVTAAFGPDFDFVKANLECNRLYQEYISNYGLPTKPGIREILEDLRARKIPLAVATSTRNPVATTRLAQVELLVYFSVVLTGDQVVHGKPAPDIYLEAVRQLGVDARISFALEDSHAGVQSAHAAGLNVIMVPDLLAPTPEIAALCTLVAPSLNEARLFFARS